MDYRVATVNNVPVPLAAIGHVRAETINHLQQVKSATTSGVPALGVSQEAALESLQALARRTLPADVLIDYAGASRQLVQESSGFVGTFVLALMIIYLSLATLFDSFRDPLVILVSITMSVTGELLFISLGLGGASLNI